MRKFAQRAGTEACNESLKFASYLLPVICEAAIEFGTWIVTLCIGVFAIGCVICLQSGRPAVCSALHGTARSTLMGPVPEIRGPSNSVTYTRPPAPIWSGT